MIYVLLIWFGLAGGMNPEPEPLDTLSLRWCYEQLQQNYPLTDKIELQQKIADLKRRNLQTGYYPRPTFQGQASYQSDITEIDFVPSNIPSPQLQNDQYSAELQVRQLIYGGGEIAGRKEVVRREANFESSQVRTDLHQVRGMLDQLYFRILQINKKRSSLEWTLRQMKAQLDMVRSQVEHGALLRSNQNVLQAEKSRLQQQLIALDYNRRAAYQMIGELLNVDIDTSTVVQLPSDSWKDADMTGMRQRPEFGMLQNRRQLLEARKEVVASSRMPEISAFGMAGYGRPGLNRFDPDFDSYYIVGIRLKWSMRDFLNTGREIDQLTMKKRMLGADREALSRRISSNLQKLQKEREKLNRLMQKDREIVAEREQIVETSQSQLKNGIITSSEYLDELYEAKRARLQLELHKVDLMYVNTQIATELNKSWVE